MWPKWVHKHLQEVAKDVFSSEKLYIDFLSLLTEIFYADFEDEFDKDEFGQLLPARTFSKYRISHESCS